MHLADGISPAIAEDVPVSPPGRRVDKDCRENNGDPQDSERACEVGRYPEQQLDTLKRRAIRAGDQPVSDAERH
ncbi:hypothetical protein [Accumulibacter sp.]|uniref:hypothetical protein n=1 Tax=Accumulibacter sp. TaxID=2053492 RepID=UPI0025BE8C03|nr:hypothetical protein [Accumulibacter sp.]